MPIRRQIGRGRRAIRPNDSVLSSVPLNKSGERGCKRLLLRLSHYLGKSAAPELISLFFDFCIVFETELRIDYGSIALNHRLPRNCEEEAQPLLQSQERYAVPFSTLHIHS